MKRYFANTGIKPDKADVSDALAHIADDEDTRANLDSLMFEGIIEMPPAEVEYCFGICPCDFDQERGNDLAAGWLGVGKQRYWAGRLNLAYRRDFKHIVKLYKEGKLPPAIQIDGSMGDGLGRSLFYYALGVEKMPVAVYVSRDK